MYIQVHIDQGLSIEDIGETSQYEKTDMRTEYDKNDNTEIVEGEEEKIKVKSEVNNKPEEVSTDYMTKLEEYDKNDNTKITEEEEEKIDTESEVNGEAEVSMNYMTKLEERRMKELAAKVEEQKKHLRYLIRIEQEKDDASDETLITPEDEITLSDRVSTESSIHPCLREIDISDSQLKIVNPYTAYPIPEDPGLLPAFWQLHERPPIYDTDGVKKFHDTVKRLGLRPINSLKDMLVTDEINLRYYGIKSEIMRPICDALMDNTFVRKLDLKDNKLSANACRHLNHLLLKNNSISNLSLSGCQIGASGAKNLYDAIFSNTSLKTLDLSNCNIGNEGFTYIVDALSNNEGLESVDISNNHLNEECSENLQNLLSRSETLMDLNLSWNSLYSAKTWKALINGFKRNETLRSLNLSWNALETQCVPYLCQLLSYSQSIEKLNLSWNQFTKGDAINIAKALSKNITLQELNLGNNPLGPQGALALVHAITPHESPDSVLYLLDLENVWANKDILHDMEIIQNFKPSVTIKLGGILSNYQLVGPNVRRILFERANYETMKRKRQRRNFRSFVMSLQEKMISQKKFVQLVQKYKLTLSKSLIDEIMNVFEGPKKTVNQGLLKASYLEEYPGTT